VYINEGIYEYRDIGIYELGMYIKDYETREAKGF